MSIPKPLIWAAILTVLLLVLVGCGLNGEGDCHRRGGTYVQTGTITTFVKSGKVLVPIATPIYDCQMPR